MGKSGFTVISETKFILVLLFNYCTIYLYHNCKPAFPPTLYLNTSLGKSQQFHVAAAHRVGGEKLGDGERGQCGERDGAPPVKNKPFQ